MIGIGPGLLIVSYALFAGEVLLIIPEQNPETWNSEIDLDDFMLYMLIGSHLNSGTSIVISEGKKYLLRKKWIEEIPIKSLHLENKVIITCFSFVLPLIAFVIYNCLFKL